MASRDDSGSGVPGGSGDARASQSVLAAPAFRTPTLAAAEAASSATAQRWAPDGPAATRGPGMRALQFVDRHLATYLGGRHLPTGRSERAAPSVSWLFPIPWWYGDEVAWLAAERAVQERRPGSGVTERAGRFDLPLELVAPSLAAAAAAPGGRSGRAGAAGGAAGGWSHVPGGPSLPSHRAAWRAYSPLVDGAAARAAEFLAELVFRTRSAFTGASAEERRGELARAVDGGPESARRPAPLLAYVTPHELAGGAAPDAAAASALAEAARRAIEDRRVSSVRGPDAGPGAAPAALSGRHISPGARALQLLAANVLAGKPDQVAPAAGPRVLLPAGLGGLVAAAAAARAIHRPAASASAPGQAETGSISGVARTLATARPAALDHVLWADRWLARFAGASPGALRSFDLARPSLLAETQLSLSGAGAPAWTQEWVSPRGERRGGEAAGPGTADEPGRATGGPPFPALIHVVVDEDEPVSDSVFGAIAAAAAAERASARGAGRPGRTAAAGGRAGGLPAPDGPAMLAGPFRPPIADRALAGFAIGGSPGLGASLASSPVASILAGLMEIAPEAVFDARPLSPAALREFLAQGAFAARPAPAARERSVQEPAPASGLLERLAARAPGSVWLALPGLSGPGSVHLAWAAGRRESGADRAPPGPRPGDVAVRAESFSHARAVAAADLALDFLAAEVLAAARVAGMGPMEAVRAQRLAASGRPHLAALAAAVDRVFVDALSGPSAPDEAGGAAVRSPAAARAAGTAERDAISIARREETAQGKAAPARSPRGAFLLPETALRALGVRAGAAESIRPNIGIALDLVAASQVAKAAGDHASMSAVLAGVAGARAPAVAGNLAAAATASNSALASDGDLTARDTAGTVRGPADAARVHLPPDLWPVFDAVYPSLGEDAETRPLAPSARAARGRSLALASRAAAARGRSPAGAGITTTFIETAAPARPAAASPPSAAPPPPSRPAPASASPAPSGDMAWFYEAARKYFGESGPSSGGGITLAELTLVTTAPRTQIAASARTADRATTQSASTTSVGAESGVPGEAQAARKPDIDKIAQEVFEQICRMMAVARERSGDPWQR